MKRGKSADELTGWRTGAAVCAYAAAAPNVEFHGSGGNVYAGGDFAREKTRGTMTIKFKPSAKGPITITGKYKICICSDKICSPQTVDISIPVNVK